MERLDTDTVHGPARKRFSAVLSFQEGRIDQNDGRHESPIWQRAFASWIQLMSAINKSMGSEGNLVYQCEYCMPIYRYVVADPVLFKSYTWKKFGKSLPGTGWRLNMRVVGRIKENIRTTCIVRSTLSSWPWLKLFCVPQ